MKKLFFIAMVATVLSFFNACQKDELVLNQLTDGAQAQVMVKPDVYVENDYLVLKVMKNWTV